MAINDTRSMTSDFNHGAADGSVKSLAPDRGGEVETTDLIQREMALRTNRSPLDSIDIPVQPWPRGDLYIG